MGRRGLRGSTVWAHEAVDVAGCEGLHESIANRLTVAVMITRKPQ